MKANKQAAVAFYGLVYKFVPVAALCKFVGALYKCASKTIQRNSDEMSESEKEDSQLVSINDGEDVEGILEIAATVSDTLPSALSALPLEERAQLQSVRSEITKFIYSIANIYLLVF